MATTITKDMVKQAIGLGTVNPRVLTDFFYRVKFKSYDYDYLIQEQLIDLQTFHASFYDCFTHTKLLRNAVRTGYYDKVGVMQVDKSLVYYGKRKEFHENSSLNNIPIPMTTVMAHRDIFKFAILVFVNGVINNNFTVGAKDDKTFLYFPYNTFIKTITSTDVIDVAFIPRSVIYTSRTLAASDQPTAGSIYANTSVFPTATLSVLKECNGFIAFLNPTSSSMNSLLRTDVTYDSTNNLFVFANKATLPADLTKFTLTVIGVEDYKQVLSYGPDTTYLEITKEKMPVPKNNMLVLIQDSNGISYHLNYNDITITEKYPNIYQVTNTKGLYYSILVLYTNKTNDDLFDYDTEIDEYLNAVNLLDRYKATNVPSILSNYTPIKWDYNLHNYAANNNITDTTNMAWYPLLYKLNKISSIYKLWCYFFKYYIEKTYSFLPGWVLDMSKVDLTEKVRYNTLPELTTTSGYYKTFSKGQYVFAYKNITNNQTTNPYSWFIDGKFRVPTYRATYKGYEYVYFNQSDITSTSIMEVERYDQNVWEKTVNIPAAGVDITFSWVSQAFAVNALFLSHTDGGYITNGTEYTLTITDEVMGEIELDLDNSDYVIMPNQVIHFAPKSSEYADKDIVLNCNNQSYVYNMTFSSDYSTFNDMNLNLTKQIARAKYKFLPRIRVFNAEGRLFPKYAYKELDAENASAITPPKFQVNVPVSEGDPFQVQYMGYDEVQVLAMDQIPINGYLNLEGKIKRPFSLKYYDVFLNGYKLNSTQIKIITPFYIAIQNVKTRKSLVIYERKHGDELFAYDADETSNYLADKLFTADSAYYTEVINSLTDIIEDTSISDMISEANAIKLSFYRDWVAKTFINGDVKYDAASIEATVPGFDIIFGDDWRYLFSLDTSIGNSIDVRNIFYLNHDANIELDPTGNATAAQNS